MIFWYFLFKWFPYATETGKFNDGNDEGNKVKALGGQTAESVLISLKRNLACQRAGVVCCGWCGMWRPVGGL